MSGSEATCSTTAHEVVVAAAGATQTNVNQQNMNHLPHGETSLDIEVPLHSNLIHPPPGIRIVQAPQLGVPTPRHVEGLEISHGFNILEVNLGVNELLNGIYNIVH